MNKPEDITTTSEELQGINLFWKDKSNHEESYKIEKDEGGGFYEIATLSANSESYFDVISGILDPPLQLTYRIKARNSSKESDWTDISINYAGLGSPSDLQITNTSSANLKIEWQDNSQIETGYSIERKKDLGDFSEIAQVGADTSFFYDRISELGTYTYRVRTMKDGLFSSFSNEVFHDVIIIFPTDGLIAFYPFNGNANDESGNENHGILHGNSVQFVNGLFDQAIKLDNSNSGNNTVNDYVELPKISINELSVSQWVKYISGSATSYSGAIYSIGTFPSKQFRVVIDNSGNVGVSIVFNSSSFGTAYVDISDHQWHLITVTIKDDYTKLCHNDILVDSTYLGFNLNFINDYQQIALHRFSGSMSSRFTGEIENFRIYNIVLTLSEILQLYQEGY